MTYSFDDFHVLRVDLSRFRWCHHSLGPRLEPPKPSIAHFLNSRLEAALAHVNKLKVRIADTRSKVLVTGDLNFGKSTLVYVLLHRDVLPIDQQPLTSVFCEVHDALENEGVEEVHVIQLDKVGLNDRTNLATFTRARVEDTESLQDDPDAETPPDYQLKLYVSDPRSHGASALPTSLSSMLRV